MKYSITLEKIVAKDKRLKSYEPDSDGHWIYLEDGYVSGYETSCLREGTVTEMIDAIYCVGWDPEFCRNCLGQNI